MSVVAIDFESFYSSKLKYSLKTIIAEQYCRHELFDPYIIAVCDGKTSWAGHPKNFNWHSLDGHTLLAHNSYFEQSVLKEMHRRGMIHDVLANIPAIHCTANMSAYLCNLRSLDQAAEKLLQVKVDKSARSDANNKKWPEGFSEAEQKTMLEYAKGDVFYCWSLWNKFSAQWPEHERELSRLSIEQGLRGLQIDTELLSTYIIQSHELLMNTERVIPWIIGAEDPEWDEFNTKPTSTKCIAEQCRRDGIPCAPVKSDDEEVYEEWENTYAPTHPWIQALGAWRTVNRIYKTFLVLKQRLRDDGTVPFELKYFAAHTGRWGGGSKFNLQNMPKRPLIMNERGLLELDEKRLKTAYDSKKITGAYPEWVKYAIDMRNLIIARPGMQLITSDLSQIEPRVLAWLSGDTAMLQSMAAGNSPYEAHARVTMGFTGVSLKDEDPEKYTLAKVRVLSLGYQAGWEKLIVMAANYGLDITKNDPEFVEEFNQLTGVKTQVPGYGTVAKQTVKDFREQNPKIVNLWKQLDEAFKRSTGSDFSMRLPSGRCLRYEKVRCEARVEKDKKTAKPVKKTVFTALVGSKRVITYGGKLTENITQAVARDVFGQCLLALDKEGYACLFHVHDEAVVEVPMTVTKEQIAGVMGRPVPMLPGITIASDSKIVACYTK